MEIGRPLLEGVRVVELASYVAAPSCGKTLADWGAEVIKIEETSGDFLRSIGSLFKMPTKEDENPAFDIENSNKLNVCLNIKMQEGKEVLHKLLSTADVFLTNVRTGSLKKLGLSYDELKEKYPGLIFAQVLGYGEEGPAKDKPGFDYTAYYARGGIAGTLYEKGTSPLNPAPGLGDHQVGVFLAGGICAALFSKLRTGKGEKVTVSLYHTAVYTMGFMLLSAQYGNVWPVSRKHPNSPLLNAYLTKDEKWIQIACTDYEGYLPKFAKAISCETLVTDERYNRVEGMKEHTEEVVDIIEKCFVLKEIDEWDKILTDADLPFERILTWNEVNEDEQAWANNYLHKMEYPNGNTATLVRTPVVFKEMGLPPYKIAERIGASTDDILKKLGYSSTEIAKLINDNAVKQSSM